MIDLNGYGHQTVQGDASVSILQARICQEGWKSPLVQIHSHLASTLQVSVRAPPYRPPRLATLSSFTLRCLPIKSPPFYTSSGTAFSFPSWILPIACFYLRIQEHSVHSGYTSISIRNWFFLFNFPKGTMPILIIFINSTSVY